MTKNRIRVGIIGTSWWSDLMFLPSFQSHPGAETVAICGRNRDRAEEMAGKYNVPRVFTDYRELIAKGNLDAVVVATPDDLHYQMTMDALDAGLHVLCEKPMALNAQHAREMYEKAQATGLKHMVLFTWRWQPHFRYLKQLVDEGYIGRCFNAQFRFLTGVGLEPSYEWRTDNQRSNGVISDLGAHMIDFARWYVGDIRNVSAHLASFVDHPGADDQPQAPINNAAFVTLQFDNEALGLIHASSVAHQADRAYVINVKLHGESGTLEAELIMGGPGAGASIRGATTEDEQFSRLVVPEDLLENLDEGELFDPYIKQSAGPRLFIEAILEDQPVSPSFFDGFKVQEVIDAALESQKSACRVSLS